MLVAAVQADTGALSGYRRDATVRSVGVGWRKTADGIEAVRRASAQHVCLCRITAPPPGSPSLLKAPEACSTAAHLLGQRPNLMRHSSLQMLAAGEARLGDTPSKDRFARVERSGSSKRGLLVIETYTLDLLDGPKPKARPLAAAGSAIERAPVTRRRCVR
jgi:hypothetical protein